MTQLVCSSTGGKESQWDATLKKDDLSLHYSFLTILAFTTTYSLSFTMYTTLFNQKKKSKFSIASIKNLRKNKIANNSSIQTSIRGWEKSEQYSKLQTIHQSIWCKNKICYHQIFFSPWHHHQDCYLSTRLFHKKINCPSWCVRMRKQQTAKNINRKNILRMNGVEKKI